MCPVLPADPEEQGKEVRMEEDKKGVQSLSWSPDQLQHSGPGQGEDVLPKGLGNQRVSQGAGTFLP